MFAPKRIFCCPLILLLSACAIQQEQVLLKPTEQTTDIEESVTTQETLIEPEITPPTWYLNLESAEHIVVGYGSGKNRQEARAQAAAEIATFLQSRVRSRFVENQQEEMSTDGELRYQRSSDRVLQIDSEAELRELPTLKIERKNGLYYLALGYDTRPLVARIKDRASCDGTGSQVQAATGYLAQSRLGRELRRAGCDQRLALERRNSVWYLRYGDQSFWLDSNFIVDSIFSNAQAPGFELGLSAGNFLEAGSNFFVRLRHTGALEQTRYLSLFHVDASGNVQSLFVNRPYPQAGELVEFPDPRTTKGLKPIPERPDARSVEMLLAFSCAQSQAEFERYLPVAEDHYNSMDENTRRLGGLFDTVVGCLNSSRVYAVGSNN